MFSRLFRKKDTRNVLARPMDKAHFLVCKHPKTEFEDGAYINIAPNETAILVDIYNNASCVIDKQGYLSVKDFPALEHFTLIKNGRKTKYGCYAYFIRTYDLSGPLEWGLTKSVSFNGQDFNLSISGFCQVMPYDLMKIARLINDQDIDESTLALILLPEIQETTSQMLCDLFEMYHFTHELEVRSALLINEVLLKERLQREVFDPVGLEIKIFKLTNIVFTPDND